MICKVRVCELLPGDSFSMSGYDYYVREIKQGRIVYMKYSFTVWGNLHPNGHLLTMGCKSQQFVNLIKRKNEHTSDLVVQNNETKDGIIRPVPDKKSPS
jgi:hypothetical protein